MHTRIRIALQMLAFAAMLAAPARAQHTGHQAPAQPAAGATSEAVAACGQSSQQALQGIDAVQTRLELARQANSPGEMRAAMDDLQVALAVMKQQLSGCAALAPPAEAMDHSKKSPGSTSSGREPHSGC